jgi:segregation and condensation protein A
MSDTSGVPDLVTAGFRVDQDGFEGTLNELASALRRGRLAPTALDLRRLVNDFLRYFERHAERDLDLASEALPAVAQVIELKLRLLLPRPPRVDEDETMEEARGEAVEAVETLARLEHAIAFLRERRERRRHLVAARPPDVRFPRRTRPIQVALGRLAALAARYRANAYFELVRDRLSVPEAMRRILERLRTVGRADFASLSAPADWSTRTVFFAGLLELVRERRVVARQDHAFEPIEVEHVDERA